MLEEGLVEEARNINDLSQSIKNQKEFLTGYAIENGFTIVDIYADDGISGTTFDRQEFNRMLEDIENGRINMVITKDLSRNAQKEVEQWIRELSERNGDDKKIGIMVGSE